MAKPNFNSIPPFKIINTSQSHHKLQHHPEQLSKSKIYEVFSHNSFHDKKYYQDVRDKNLGLNHVKVDLQDPFTGEIKEEKMSQREVDALIYLQELNCCRDDDDLPSYDSLMSDSEDEGYDSDTNFDYERWKSVVF